MKIKYTLPKSMAILALIIAFASCEEDFNTIGVNIIGDENFQSEFTDSLSVIAYSRKLLPPQTNALPVYQLGVYNDPVYGKRTVNFLAQLTLDSPDPDFEIAPIADSVVLYIPYFSTEMTNNEVVTYDLDSVYGNTPININIYESNFFLRDFDPDTGFQEPQNYYANQRELFENFKGELIHSINDFTPSEEALVLNDSVSLIPGLRANLSKTFFQEKILDQNGSIQLINNNNFRDYFRGLYFEVESATDDGNLTIMNLEEANVTIYYTFQTEGTGIAAVPGDTIQRFNGEVQMNFNAISVNTYDNTIPADISEELANPNITDGEERLYVRGGDGIVSVIELFGPDLDEDGVADELEDLRNEEWLINEANLIFYVDTDRVTGGEQEPERLVIYDIKNSAFLADISLDITSNLEPVDALNVHLGRLKRGTDENGEFYKIRITNHVSNLINNDSTNVPLGLIVSHNVLESDFQDLENIQAPGIEQVPAASIVSPEGTVLHGNRSANTGKRLKLQIFYTKPE
ncbi:MAG: DUF4270 domain-containing protein [Bacteroidia bacterium]|nr:DUF4270 domain-containing protein [Bacteroidia bacterium]NNF30465.1 DUF4270 domain-containing protein [Flavobacteriaceae bacterium]NNJ80669.1 DUF4270 domain-containing protein [Flavobacteriaceae bacterium]NNM07778.1 DUF4270 domain-containing protein [Flavobacteriaceae bacterium]